MSQKNDTSDVDNSSSISVKILLGKQIVQTNRKSSFQDYDDRPNFCCRYQFQEYTVMRVYINSIYSPSIKLYYTKFIPKQKKATICIIHGFGETTDQYLQTASFYAKNGFVVNMIDLRGFGYSGGSRVTSCLKGTISDIETLLRFCCQLNLPTYILSHGLGATMLLALLEENPDLPISGVILSGTLLNFPNENRGSLFHKMLLFFGTNIFDELLINNLINPTALTKDPKQIQRRLLGVFRFQYLSLRMSHNYDLLTEKVRKHAFKFTYPVLVCHGGKDIIQPLDTIYTFFDEINSTDKEIKIFSEAYHQIHNDIESYELNNYVFRWINSSKMTPNRNNIKWGKTKPFNLDTIALKSYLKHIIFFISAFIFMYKIYKSYKKIP